MVGALNSGNPLREFHMTKKSSMTANERRALLNPSLSVSDSWSGLRPGDRVFVNLPREMRCEYVFVAHVRNSATNDEWIEVNGGRPGEAKSRSFRPELIFPESSRKGSKIRGPSSLDAPQLPWS